MTSIQFETDFDPRYGEIIDVAPGIRRVVARNPGPFTGPGTGTYIVGTGEVAVIDPGPMMPDHVEAIISGLAGEHISHIIVTHTHSDHSPASRLLQNATGAAVLGFGRHSSHSAGALEGGVDRDFEPDFTVEDGEYIEGGNWSLEAIHTPGHCSNHLCFALKDSPHLFCGDQLMAWSTPVILPPDGSIIDYLDSLERLAARAETTYYPTHGLPITAPGALIASFIQHRLRRIEQVRDALAIGINTLRGLRQAIYPDISTALFSGAELSLRASLEYMQHKGWVDTGPSPSPEAQQHWRLL